MNYAEIKTTDIANGEGVRVSLFVSGCRRHCKGCFNSQTWDFHFGKPFTRETEDYIINKLSPSYISGLTLLGGDPMEPENQKVLYPFIKRVRAFYPDKTIWCYTGYTFNGDMLCEPEANTEITRSFIGNLDVLVDGKFEENLKDLRLQFRGSSNQRIINIPASLALDDIQYWSKN